jgi:glycosyltransferase involved in cell wall biosynthesis
VKRGVARGRIAVIPNAAGRVFFEAPACPAPVAQLESGRWFGYIGSLHPWQGIDVLLHAWARIAEDWPEAGMFLLHNNSRVPLKRVRKLVRRLGLESRVLLHPPLAPPAVAAALRRLEFTCAPLQETARNTVQGCCPLKIVESMAVGVPVLSSDLRVSRELIASGCNGLWVAPGEPRAWATALHRMLGDASFRGRLAAGAAATAQAHFTPEAACDKLAAWYAEAELQSRLRRNGKIQSPQVPK